MRNYAKKLRMEFQPPRYQNAGGVVSTQMGVRAPPQKWWKTRSPLPQGAQQVSKVLSRAMNQKYQEDGFPRKLTAHTSFTSWKSEILPPKSVKFAWLCLEKAQRKTSGSLYSQAPDFLPVEVKKLEKIQGTRTYAYFFKPREGDNFKHWNLLGRLKTLGAGSWCSASKSYKGAGSWLTTSLFLTVKYSNTVASSVRGSALLW